jgi:hypothetical protein
MMHYFNLHHLGFSLPLALTAADLPQLCVELFGIEGINPDTVRQSESRHGYAEWYSLRGEHGAELVSILLQGMKGNRQGTSHIDIHGAALEQDGLDVRHICQEIINRRGWGTSIHLAADDHNNLLPWEEIKECCLYDQYKNRITTHLCKPSKDRKTGKMQDNPPVFLREQGETLYLGKADSDTSICMYTRRGPVRVEIRLRNRAVTTDVIRRIAAGEELGEFTAGIIRYNLAFHVPGSRRKDRRPVCQWWTDFLGNTEALRLPRVRDNRHISPWYVPCNLADVVEKGIRRHLHIESVRDKILEIAAEIKAGRLFGEVGVPIPPDSFDPCSFAPEIVF